MQEVIAELEGIIHNAISGCETRHMNVETVVAPQEFCNVMLEKARPLLEIISTIEGVYGTPGVAEIYREYIAKISKFDWSNSLELRRARQIYFELAYTVEQNRDFFLAKL